MIFADISSAGKNPEQIKFSIMCLATFSCCVFTGILVMPSTSNNTRFASFNFIIMDFLEGQIIQRPPLFKPCNDFILAAVNSAVTAQAYERLHFILGIQSRRSAGTCPYPCLGA